MSTKKSTLIRNETLWPQNGRTVNADWGHDVGFEWIAIERPGTLAIQEGLADIEAGRTHPVREALAVLAKQHGLTVPEN